MPILAIDGAVPPDHIEVGQIWLEIESNRYIKIVEKEVHGTGPAWTYCDEQGNSEPHGYEKANGYSYDEWFFHYCDLFDFCVWGRFKFVRS